MKINIPTIESIPVLAEKVVARSQEDEFHDDLDYSLESLSTVSEILATLSILDREKRVVLADFLIAMGCYVGEVICRSFDYAQWGETTNIKFRIPVIVRLGPVMINPMEKVMDAVMHGKGEPYNFYDWLYESLDVLKNTMAEYKKKKGLN